MGQKVRPTSLRLGITEDWRSHWVANKKLLTMHTLAMLLVLIFVTCSALFGEGCLGKRACFLMRLITVTSCAVNIAMSCSIHIFFANIQRYFFTSGTGLDQVWATMAC